jgi:hypothetical protein
MGWGRVRGGGRTARARRTAAVPPRRRRRARHRFRAVRAAPAGRRGPAVPIGGGAGRWGPGGGGGGGGGARKVPVRSGAGRKQRCGRPGTVGPSSSCGGPVHAAPASGPSRMGGVQRAAPTACPQARSLHVVTLPPPPRAPTGPSPQPRPAARGVAPAEAARRATHRAPRESSLACGGAARLGAAAVCRRRGAPFPPNAAARHACRRPYDILETLALA